MLKTLCELPGISGDEGKVHQFIEEQMRPLVDRVETDKMGNLICFKKGTGNRRAKLMLSAHMDEVGLIVTGITKEGYLRFQTVGGIDSRVLVSKRVRVGNDGIPGVIGTKPAHMLRGKEGVVLSPKELFIDLGTTEQQAKELVCLGDSVVFDSDFVPFGDDRIKAKALDDRVGCYLLMQLAEQSFPNDIAFVFTVQEEVGCRGAAVAAYGSKPDFALVVEGTTCSDVPGTEDHQFSTHMGSGPALSILDGGAYADREMTGFLYQTARDHALPIQYKQTTMGGNDSRAIHLSGEGVRTAAISIPCRYLHAPASVVAKADVDACLQLLQLALKKEDAPWNF